MDNHTKLEIAKEIIANKIGDAIVNKKLTINDKELLDLIAIKDQITKCNIDVIEELISYYGGKAND